MPEYEDAEWSASADAPRPEPLQTFFRVDEIRREDGCVRYVGESYLPERTLLRKLIPPFREAGYEVEVESVGGRHVVVATPVSRGHDGVPWVNGILFVATVFSTLFVGAYGWYYISWDAIAANPLVLLRAWPFTAAVLGVLMVHELGHYAAGRYHGVDVSLPYVIPFVFPFGTLGAVIRMRDRMPSRRALFDIGAAGPIAGLVATVIVTAIGLSLDPMRVPTEIANASGTMIRFNNPPLLGILADLLGQPTAYEDPSQTAHPVVIGGWVGMFFTLLNLLPVGQLDGGHMMRAMVGPRQETLASLVPGALFALAAYLHFGRGLGLDESVGLWAFWGVFALVIAFNGPANPSDEEPLGWRRLAVGVGTFAVGALCFLPVPIQVISP
ncbi:site-2 protease family protein [Halorubrum sp. CBA1125]|uniref:site-2 protease family protein n=1 Tax=Halorubrum sp. CBA1125 TaxID=2668072 RepID=UPI0012E87E77|nr:site-2 protease family protein [Halorubrum sp. CBA1125]MUW15317.1 site-2 protease family protein [Halorubrum sp. CBA1125]